MTRSIDRSSHGVSPPGPRMRDRLVAKYIGVLGVNDSGTLIRPEDLDDFKNPRDLYWEKQTKKTR